MKASLHAPVHCPSGHGHQETEAATYAFQRKNRQSSHLRHPTVAARLLHRELHRHALQSASQLVQLLDPFRTQRSHLHIAARGRLDEPRGSSRAGPLGG